MGWDCASYAVYNADVRTEIGHNCAHPVTYQRVKDHWLNVGLPEGRQGTPSLGTGGMLGAWVNNVVGTGALPVNVLASPCP